MATRGSSYDPQRDPLDLPVQVLDLRCTALRALHLPPREGTMPDTTLGKAFDEALRDVACAQFHSGGDPCGVDESGSSRCHSPMTCIQPWLYKPRSAVLGRDFTRPIMLRAAILDACLPVTEFGIRLTLWGRHAVAARSLVEEAVVEMGLRGLRTPTGNVPFVVTTRSAASCATLAERAEELRRSAPQHLLLEFETPFMHIEKDEQRRRKLLAGGWLPLDRILGNTAMDLVAWDMEERDLDPAMDRLARDALMQRAKEFAKTAAATVEISRCRLTPAPVGMRLSKSNEGTFFLGGFIGTVDLTGDLIAALPWLVALSLGGSGQKRSFGFGAVGMWLPSTNNHSAVELS